MRIREAPFTLLFVLAALAAATAAAQVPDVSGSWTGTSLFGPADHQMSIDLVMHLERSVNQLTGWLALQSDNRKRLEIANGKVDGSAVTFDLVVPDQSQTIMNIQGHVTKDRMEGGFNSIGARGDKVAGEGAGKITGAEITLDWSASRDDKTILRGKLHFTKK
jgi:hypothetical protein